MAPERVAEAAIALREALERHHFDGAVAGHASAGNLHFTLVFNPADPADVRRYADCIEDVVGVVLDQFDGSLKGEHATGRNMAPFVEREWGPRLTDLMRQVKALIDPAGILGAGVIFTDDPHLHLRNLKDMPAVHPELDRCIECGFCEPVCPSRELTTTPRQRIALKREIARQADPRAAQSAQHELTTEYTYAAIDTCAGDASCALACPVSIDTGAVMKGEREARHSARSERVALGLARRWAVAERVARGALWFGRHGADRFGDAPWRAVTGAVRRIAGTDLVPEWLPETPGPAPRIPRGPVSRDSAEIVYFPACINRIFGAPPGAPDSLTVTEAVTALAERAGIALWVPPDVAGSCCATVWHSKGYAAANEHAANDVVDRLWRWTDQGRLPVVVDSSSCALGLIDEVVPYLDGANAERHRGLRIIDTLAWARTEVLPRVTITERVPRLAMHVNCSTRHLGNAADLHAVANALADESIEPIAGTCCGFAGDRGFLHRELPESATRADAAAVAAWPADQHVSNNRPCELGLQHTTGEVYESAIVALERATRPAPQSTPADPRKVTIPADSATALDPRPGGRPPPEGG